MNSISNPMWLPAAARDRRILAIAILVFIFIVVLAAIIVPIVLLHRHYDENISKMSRQLNSQSGFNVLRPKLITAMDALKTKDPKRLFLKGATAALAGAELQDQVKSIIEAAGGRVAVVQPVPTKDDGAFRIVATTYHLNINNANLRRMLHALETREPSLFIDTLIIRSIAPPGYRPQPGAPDPEVFVQMDISGIARPAVAPAAGSQTTDVNAKSSGKAKP